MTVGGGEGTLSGMDSRDLSILNALVTATIERLDNELNGSSESEREVAKIVGGWCLSGVEVAPVKERDTDTPMGAQIGRDNAISDLCERIMRFIDTDEAGTLESEDVRETIDSYIVDAVLRLRHLRVKSGPDLITSLVHTEGGIDALNDLREKLTGARLDVSSIS